MNRNTFIHLVADYGTGDGAFGEVIQKLHSLSPDITVYPTSVPKFSTIATGFWIAQYALVNPVPGMIIFSNTAPRKDNKEVRRDNEGEGFMYASLQNGVRVLAVNSGYCFSFIKPYIKEFRPVMVPNKGSQFRSRDFYPQGVIGVMQNNPAMLGDLVGTDSIATVPSDRIAWVDGYGNIKTTMRSSQVSFTIGQAVSITINGMKRTAFYTDGTFSVREGELAFAPGSSGGDDKCMEVFLRGLSAYVEFGKPAVESSFAVEKV
jgi:hypothetical protein